MKHVKLSYANFKTLIAKKNLTWQYEEWSDKYRPFAMDSSVTYYAIIYKSPITVGGLDAGQEQTNQTDFETNYKNISNFAIGSRPYAFSTPDFQFSGDAILSTIPKGTTANIDFQIPGGAGTFKYINGAILMSKNAVFGDYVNSVVIDKDNILGYGANTVLATYITKWYIDVSDKGFELTTPYAGKLLAGLYLRVTYTSIGAVNDPEVALNIKLHTPL